MSRQYSADDSPNLDEDEGEYDQQQDHVDEHVGDDNEEEETEMDQDDEDTEPRVLSQEEIEKRNAAYGTITRSQSELDLRQAAMTPPPGNGSTKKRKNSLLSVREESEDEPPPSQQQQNAGKPKSFSARKMSMADLGMATFKYPTQFDEVDGEDEEDENGDAPGAFKRPKSAFTLARTDLMSRDWQAEIEGLEAVVRLIKWHRVTILRANDPSSSLSHCISTRVLFLQSPYINCRKH